MTRRLFAIEIGSCLPELIFAEDANEAERLFRKHSLRRLETVYAVHEIDLRPPDIEPCPCPRCGEKGERAGDHVCEIDGNLRDYPVSECKRHKMDGLLGPSMMRPFFQWLTDANGRPRDIHNYELIEVQPQPKA